MDTRVKHEYDLEEKLHEYDLEENLPKYDNKAGVILVHTFFIVILGLVPIIHLKPLDTRDKPEYDIEENLPEYDNSNDFIDLFFLIL
ncbi:MAG: hypothetical protein E7017_05400 [Alphaproteobacteria bacterium]|nr:hypothetical protein [Alphaproteobacteria bacterium]